MEHEKELTGEVFARICYAIAAISAIMGAMAVILDVIYG